MPLSTLDPTPALIVIDLQKGLEAMPTAPHRFDSIVGQAARLTMGFREHGHPVVLVTATGGAPGRTEIDSPADATPPPGWADLVDQLNPHPDDHLITKTRWGAFHKTTLDPHLRDLGVTQVVIAGIATSMGVESTARAAHEHGYHVVLATDAMTDINPDAHTNSIQRIFPHLGETTTTDEIIEQLRHS